MKQITLYIRDEQFEKLEQEENKSETIRRGLDLYYSQNIDEEGVVYCIRNIKNGKEYIGSTKNLNQRINTHFNSLKNNNHHNKDLQLDWNEQTSDSFEIIILDFKSDIKVARDIERQLIAEKDNIYNNKSLKKDNEDEVLDVISKNPFLNLEEIAEEVGCDSNYVRQVLSKKNLTLSYLRSEFSKKVTGKGIKLDLEKYKKK